MTAEFDLLVIGSGPAGQRAAVQAAKLGKRVALIERERLGGYCLHTGTIPSKTLKSGAELNDLGTSLRSVLRLKNRVISEEERVIAKQLKRNHVEVLFGEGRFVDSHQVEVARGNKSTRLSSKVIMIATGSRPRRPIDIPFDGKSLLDSDEILRLKTLPRTMAVIGGGVIGCEYASIFSKLGSRVTLYDQREGLLRHLDDAITQALVEHFESGGMKLVLGGDLKSVRRTARGVSLNFSGKQKTFDVVLFCMGRTSNTETLGLDQAGVRADPRGTIFVNANFQTSQEHIYAVGDVIGFPALAATSAEQGRLACCHAFEGQSCAVAGEMPYGIYTIPEISTVGRSEKELIEKGIEFEVGVAYYRELARGQILRDDHGFLRLLVARKGGKILGVHIFGTHATELIHIGQMALNLGASVDFLVNNVFNYPTLAEAYKVAALNAANKLRLSARA